MKDYASLTNRGKLVRLNRLAVSAMERYALPVTGVALHCYATNPLYRVDTEGKQRVEVLRGVDLEVEEGEFLSLIVPSGSGKTTLLNLIGGLFPAVRAARLPIATALREL